MDKMDRLCNGEKRQRLNVLRKKGNSVLGKMVSEGLSEKATFE